SSGIGTLTYLIITRGKIPAYLGSSFAFIVPIITVSQAEGTGAALFGCFLAGLVYGLVSLLIYRFGVGWLHHLLPQVVVGSVVMVVGVALAGGAVEVASTEQVARDLPKTVEGFHALAGTVENVDAKAGTVTLKVYSLKHFSVALATLAIAIVASIIFRVFWTLIPGLIGIAGGYRVAAAVGLAEFTAVEEAARFALPTFNTQ